MTASEKSRLARDPSSIREAQDFRCPCGYQVQGTFCAERIELSRDTVKAERSATLAASTTGNKRNRMHALKVQFVGVPRRMTSERFSLEQRGSSYHYFIRGRPVCLETYTEVCAMSATTMQEVRVLARAAALENLDLINDPPPVDLCGARVGRQQQREAALKVFLTTLAEETSERIPDGATVDSLSSHIADVADVDPDGLCEYRLPFRQALMVFKLYKAGVVDPYNYPNFVKKWHLLCRHIKRRVVPRALLCRVPTQPRLRQGWPHEGWLQHMHYLPAAEDGVAKYVAGPPRTRMRAAGFGATQRLPNGATRKI
jgi:hypothetical protein